MLGESCSHDWPYAARLGSKRLSVLNRLPDPTLLSPKAEPYLSCCFLGAEGSPAYHIPRHTLGLGQLWPFQKHSAKNMSSQSLARKTPLEEGEQTGPQARPLEGKQAGAAGSQSDTR